MEYKFRAWDKEDKRMITDEQDFIPLKVTSIGVLRLSPTHNSAMYTLYDPERFELMQFTGLQDKNEKDIYEGDKIRIEHPHKSRSFEGSVEYSNYKFHCKDFVFSHFDNPTDIFSEGTKYIEITGNIHDKKES